MTAPALGATLGGTQSTQSVDVKSLLTSEVHAKETQVALGRSTEISATVHNGAASAQAATAYLYDGNPDAHGRLFGVQRLVNVESGDDYKVRVKYTAQSCGDHEIYMKVGRNGAFGGSVKALETVAVSCPTPGKQQNSGGCSMSGRSTSTPWGMLATTGMLLLSWIRRRRKGAQRAERSIPRSCKLDRSGAPHFSALRGITFPKSNLQEASGQPPPIKTLRQSPALQAFR